MKKKFTYMLAGVVLVAAVTTAVVATGTKGSVSLFASNVEALAQTEEEVGIGECYIGAGVCNPGLGIIYHGMLMKF